MRAAVYAVLACAGLLAAAPARAWGPLGHRIVADLAYAGLDARARTQVDALLARQHVASLADVANWADTIRDAPEPDALGRQTVPLHYVNMHGSCDYKPALDCPDGRCVVAAIGHYAAVLGDRGRSPDARAQALNFVVHFVGDVHQPLHAGYRQDRGANDYPVQFQGEATNLHRVWDSGLLSTRQLHARAYAALLEHQGPVMVPAAAATREDIPARWAEQSCRMVMERGVYPRGHVITADYVARMRPLAEQQLRLAGARLAALLNRVLGAPASRPR